MMRKQQNLDTHAKDIKKETQNISHQPAFSPRSPAFSHLPEKLSGGISRFIQPGKIPRCTLSQSEIYGVP